MKRYNIKIVSNIILLAIITTFLYTVTNILPFGLRSFRYLWAPLTLLAIFIVSPKVYTKTTTILLLLYGLIILLLLQYTLWKYMNDWNKQMLHDEFYSILVFIIVLHYYRDRRDFIGLAKLGKTSFYFVIITIIMTNIALSIDPLVVRQSADPEHFSNIQQRVFILTGAANYGYMQALVCLIPIIIYHIKSRRNLVISKNYLVPLLIILYVTIVRAQIFANILIALMITIISLLSVQRTLISFITIGALVVLVLVVPVTFYADLIFSISTHLNKYSNVYFKLNDFAQFILNPEIDTSTAAGGRIERYPLLIKAFLEQPILGNASYNSNIDIQPGGHLYWMNRLSQWGLIGFTFYIILLVKIYLSIRNLFNKEFGFYYFLCILTFIIFGLMKNIAGREPYLVLIVVIPSFYYLPLLNKQKI